MTLSVPREVVRDTIERAEAEESVEEDTDPPTTRLPHQEPAEQDDYYGRTREIITFAEPGNKPPLSCLGWIRVGELQVGRRWRMQIAELLQNALRCWTKPSM